jgi:iron complex transport system substrate-binding protein
MPVRRARSWIRLGLLVCAGILGPAVLAACGATDTDEQNGASASSAGPVTVKQCTDETFGRDVTYSEVPQRVVTTDAYAAELLIALGLGDKIVGTGVPFAQGQVPAEIADEYGQIKTISKAFPTYEQIAANGADFVVTTFRTDSGVYLRRDRLDQRLGVKLYGTITVCQDGPTRSFDNTYTDIRNLGEIFGVQDQAEAVVEDMQAKVDEAAAIAQDRPRVKVWTYSGEEVPFPATGGGVPNAVIWLAGGQNVFEDLPKSYAETSWEQVIARNPDAVVMMTDTGGGDVFVAAKEAIANAVKSHDGLADVTAVREDRMYPISYQIAGTINVPRNADAVLELARMLHGEG